MSSTCSGKLFFRERWKLSWRPLSPRRSNTDKLGILPFNPSCNSLHGSVHFHHFRTSLASHTLQKEILLGDCLLWIHSSTKLHLPDRQHRKSQRPGALHSLVCANSGQFLLLPPRCQTLTPLQITPLFTNAFVYMAMGESCYSWFHGLTRPREEAYFWTIFGELSEELATHPAPNYCTRRLVNLRFRKDGLELYARCTTLSNPCMENFDIFCGYWYNVRLFVGVLGNGWPWSWSSALIIQVAGAASAAGHTRPDQQVLNGERSF